MFCKDTEASFQETLNALGINETSATSYALEINLDDVFSAQAEKKGSSENLPDLDEEYQKEKKAANRLLLPAVAERLQAVEQVHIRVLRDWDRLLRDADQLDESDLGFKPDLLALDKIKSKIRETFARCKRTAASATELLSHNNMLGVKQRKRTSGTSGTSGSAGNAKDTSARQPARGKRRSPIDDFRDRKARRKAP
mmetsp:Transcript_4693/g.18752  ORF Transcript_4693/g.18752 Transcript_4693/m.18752 type:complete len:197 (-) Transcript_4693:67-657(-)